jgi:multiple sugar transport system permease protein
MRALASKRSRGNGVRRRRQAVLALRYMALLLAIFVWVVPLLWVLLTSLKERVDIFTVPPTLFFRPTLANYVDALNTYGILSAIGNSLLVAVTTVLLTLLVAVPAGYAYARLRFAGRRALSFFTLFTQMAPAIGILLPAFFIIGRLGLVDTYGALILVYLTITVPISTWLMITYFEEIPRELEEAARVDGASRFAVFTRIMLPQARGGVMVTAILAFIEAWNEFLFASVLTGSQTRTVPVAIFSFLTTEESLWGPFTATGVMIMAPVVLVALLAQRHIVKGLTFGAVK